LPSPRSIGSRGCKAIEQDSLDSLISNLDCLRFRNTLTFSPERNSSASYKANKNIRMFFNPHLTSQFSTTSTPSLHPKNKAGALEKDLV